MKAVAGIALGIFTYVGTAFAVAGDACTLSARLSDAYKGVLTCPGGRTTPLTLWLKDLNADAKAADAPG